MRDEAETSTGGPIVKIRYRLYELMGEKAKASDRIPKIKEIVEATGISRNTLYKIYHNKPGYQTNVDVLVRLGWYFGCRLDDLVESSVDQASSDSAPPSYKQEVTARVNEAIEHYQEYPAMTAEEASERTRQIFDQVHREL